MTQRRPPRLSHLAYVGVGRYFLTIRCARGHCPFVRKGAVEAAIAQLKRTACACEYALLAYCFMPDHLHILVDALSETADVLRFVSAFKQRTGFEYRRATREPLWQEGFYDRVLRREESTPRVVRYIWENPERKGLVEDFRQWPYSGSDVYDLEYFAEGGAEAPPVRRA